MRLSIAFAVLLTGGAEADRLLEQSRAALKKGDAAGALQLADQAVAAAPKSAQAYLWRGTVKAAQRQPKDAIADFDKAIALDARLGEAYDRRGSERFKLGDIEGSLQDFDAFLKLEPNEYAGHWRRGISLYYAGKYEEGYKQFAAYEKVDNNDVENSVWHLMCLSKVEGLDKARAKILKVGRDNRVPMMEVFDLFAGKLKPDDVLAAAKKDDRAMAYFYCHLYLALYFETVGEKDRVKGQLDRAVEHGRKGHYMWEVARVHRELLERRK